MIAISSSGKSFQALAWYLANGRTGAEQDRVAWSACRNLPTPEPELAGTIMRATAAQSDRVLKPVYHIALSFDPRDPVDRAAMERVADRILARLGLSEHQAVIVAHRDREHPHRTLRPDSTRSPRVPGPLLSSGGRGQFGPHLLHLLPQCRVRSGPESQVPTVRHARLLCGPD